jgi:hypothetical protein
LEIGTHFGLLGNHGKKGLVVRWYSRYASPLDAIALAPVGGMPVTKSTKKSMMAGEISDSHQYVEPTERITYVHQCTHSNIINAMTSHPVRASWTGFV